MRLALRYVKSINVYFLKIKYLAFSSQESHTGQLDLATQLKMAAQRDNAIGITLREVY